MQCKYIMAQFVTGAICDKKEEFLDTSRQKLPNFCLRVECRPLTRQHEYVFHHGEENASVDSLTDSI